MSTQRAATPQRRPFTIQLLAGLLAVYAMGGVAVVAVLLSARDHRVKWELMASTAALLSVAAGSSALSTWRMERVAHLWLLACGVAGLVFCLSMPLAWPRWTVTAEMWRASVAGGVLFLAFLAIAAVYVRRVVRGEQ